MIQGTTRWGLTVVGLLAAVLVAMVGQARAVQEVCTTAPMIFVDRPHDNILCRFMNAYAYGPVTITQYEILDDNGTAIDSAVPLPITVPPLATSALEAFPSVTISSFSCRVTFTAPLEGYGRLSITRLNLNVSPPVAETGPPATCNPF